MIEQRVYPSRPITTRIWGRMDVAIAHLKIGRVWMRERVLGAKRWLEYDSPLYDENLERKGRSKSFQSYFEHVLPAGESDLKTYIETTLGSKRGEAVGIELGGIGSSLFSQFTPGFFKQTAGIALTDYRGSISSRLKKEDDARNHTVIKGNMLTKSTKEKAIQWLNGKKIDLIIERMFAGHNRLPKDPYYMMKQVDFWYELLAEGGIVLAEVPNAFQDLLPAWAEYVQAKYTGRLEIEKYQIENERWSIRLRKLEGAPEILPHCKYAPNKKRRKFLF